MEQRPVKQKENEDLVFFIRVQYRCNSSIQGTVQWMDGRKSTIFRSALELGHLLAEARRSKAGSADREGPRWSHKEHVS